MTPQLTLETIRNYKRRIAQSNSLEEKTNLLTEYIHCYPRLLVKPLFNKTYRMALRKTIAGEKSAYDQAPRHQAKRQRKYTLRVVELLLHHGYVRGFIDDKGLSKKIRKALLKFKGHDVLYYQFLADLAEPYKSQRLLDHVPAAKYREDYQHAFTYFQEQKEYRQALTIGREIGLPDDQLRGLEFKLICQMADDLILEPLRRAP